uniref:Amino acid transporter transmembrane domain-containing protein n=1 Tax=Denticeps clupeoides TaxID=299321 RepID=A0AAY4BGA9_9TELE
MFSLSFWAMACLLCFCVQKWYSQEQVCERHEQRGRIRLVVWGCCLIHFNLLCRFDDPEGPMAESDEFLPTGEGKKPIRFTDFEGKTSFGMSVFNLGNAIMGSGILGLAYAMANTGIMFFLFLLTAVAVLSCYSIHLLLKASGVVGIRAYEQLGYRAFGMTGKLAAGIAITLQNIGAMSSYMFIVKSEFPLVIQAFLRADPSSTEWYLNGNYLVVLVSMGIILPLALMKQLGMILGYTSGFSLSCMVFFLSAVRPHCHLTSYRKDTAYTIPILAFAFVCHPEVLPIYTELRDATQRRMQHVSNLSILIMYVMYFMAALFGYLTFYGKVEPELLHTYSRIDPYDILILCVPSIAVLTAVTLTVPIVLFPVSSLYPCCNIQVPSHWHCCHPLTLIDMLVIFAPNILGIFGVIGATSAPCLIFIFPAVFYIRIVPKDEEPMSSTPKILAACFAGLGFIFMIMSLSFIIIDWTTGSSNSLGGH